MRGTSKGLRPDPVTEEVRGRYTAHVQNFERLAHESWVAATEQNRGWILRAGSEGGDQSVRASAHGSGRTR